MLDEAGATSWPHPDDRPLAVDRARRAAVVDADDLSVRYEQARGMRLPGQQSDGTFSASRTATIDGTLDAGYAAMVAAFSAELGGAAPPGAQTGSGRSRAGSCEPAGRASMASAEVAREGRVRVAVVHEKLPDDGRDRAGERGSRGRIRGRRLALRPRGPVSAVGGDPGG